MVILMFKSGSFLFNAFLGSFKDILRYIIYHIILLHIDVTVPRLINIIGPICTNLFVMGNNTQIIMHSKKFFQCFSNNFQASFAS